MASNSYGSITNIIFTKANMPGKGWCGFVTFDANFKSGDYVEYGNTWRYTPLGIRGYFGEFTNMPHNVVWPSGTGLNNEAQTAIEQYGGSADNAKIAAVHTVRSFPPTYSTQPLSYHSGVFYNPLVNDWITYHNGVFELDRNETAESVEAKLAAGQSIKIVYYAARRNLSIPDMPGPSNLYWGPYDPSLYDYGYTNNDAIVTTYAEVTEGHAAPVATLTKGAVTATSISLSWSPPPVYSGYLTNYKIYYRISGINAAWSTVTVNSLTTNHTLTGLNQLSNYEIMVKAVTSTGESAHPDQHQRSITASTPAIVVPAKPAAPTVVRQAGPAALTVSWVAPNNDGGSAILDYNVEISTDGLSWIASTTTENLSLSVTNLNTAPTYYFRVKARNSVGFSDPSDASVGITTGALPGAPGTPVPGTQVVINSVPLTWSAAADNGFAITRYDVEYSTPYISGDSPVVVASNTGLSYTVLGLANAVYVFRVRAVNEFGNGPWSGYSIEATPTGLPSPPTITEAVQFSSDADNAVVKIRIQEPAADGGLDITNYRLEFTYVNPSNNDWEDPQYPFVQSVTQEEQVLPWYQTSHMFAHPDYGTVTQVWYRVAAINPNGTGDYSAVVGPIAITPTPAIDTALLPTVITDLALTPKEGKIVVVWNAPANPGAGSTVNELLYQIQYSADGVNWTSVPYP